MQFHVGEKVVHWAYGPGEIVRLDEKELSGLTAEYYVVQIKDLTLWVPVGETDNPSLRCVTPAEQFEELVEILTGPPEPLSEDRLERKMQLSEAMRDRTVESICRVIRDLSFLSQARKLNENDNAVLERAQDLLINEWAISFSIPLVQAERTLRSLLDSSIPANQ
jgi:RNA polymerase-interacting CarD/CdnL/TRCF family regulator